MQNEFEVKFLGIDIKDLRQKLDFLGFVCACEEYMMIRKTFHKKPSKQGEWFRIRQEKNKTTMTYKNIQNESIDGIMEIEILIDNFEKASEILELAGLENTSTQENKREIWIKNDIEVCFDTWPGLKTYVEIESTSEAIVRDVANSLGFDWNLGVFGGSEAVYEIELGIPKSILVKLPEISFKNPPKYAAI